MKKATLLWILSMILGSMIIPQWARAGGTETPPMNAWTVYLDDFSDYTTTNPLFPFWITPGNATPTTLYLTPNSDTTVYPSIQTCLSVVSFSTSQDVIYYHPTRLANYSFQYFTRIPSASGWSEGLFRFNIDTAGNKYGYWLDINTLGQVLLLRLSGVSGYTTLATATFDTTEINPHEWFYVKADVSGNNIQIYLNSSSSAVINYNDTVSVVSTGSIGFRAWNTAAYYYYARVDVQAQGQWQILYEGDNTNGDLEERYIDPDSTGQAGTILISGDSVRQLFPDETDPYIFYAVPTPFGDRIIYQIQSGTNSGGYPRFAFAISSCDGSGLHLLWDFDPDNFQELESVGVDGYAYVGAEGEGGRLSLPITGEGTFTEIANSILPEVSPDGSFLSHIKTRTDQYGDPVQITRIDNGTVYIYDEWMMDALGNNNYSYASCPLTYVDTNMSIGGNNVCGFEENPQMWQWGMQHTSFEQYGPYDGLPLGADPTAIWYYDIRNGTYSEFTNMQDDAFPTPNNYPGYWAWPIDDPRGTGQMLTSYISTTWNSGLWFVSKQPKDSSIPMVGEVINQITGPILGTNQKGGFWAVWWNKPD